MKEIKFLKDLPIKLTNNNKVIDVIGGDIYYDSEGNRYGYITFKNTQKSPIFCLQLFIREYDVDGKFIKDNELFDGYCYYPIGEFVINQPVIFDKETEAIEVTIVKLTFKNRNFIDDRFVSFKAADYADLYQRKAPIKKPGTAASFSFNQPSSGPRANFDDVEYEDGSAPQEEQKSAINIEREVLPTEVKQFAKPQKNFWRFVYPLVGIVALAIIILIIVTSVTAGVNAFNAYYA